MPAPKSSIQPAPLHLEQVLPPALVPLPPQKMQETSNSTLGSVNGKKPGGKRGFSPGAEKLFNEIFDGAGEIAEGDIGIDGKTFDLMEDEGMRGVGIVAAVDLAGDNDAHRRLALFHGADLHGRGVRAEKQRRRSTFGQIEIESVHVVADRMKFGNVERFEI